MLTTPATPPRIFGGNALSVTAHRASQEDIALPSRRLDAIRHGVIRRERFVRELCRAASSRKSPDGRATASRLSTPITPATRCAAAAASEHWAWLGTVPVSDTVPLTTSITMSSASMSGSLFSSFLYCVADVSVRAHPAHPFRVGRFGCSPCRLTSGLHGCRSRYSCVLLLGTRQTRAVSGPHPPNRGNSQTKDGQGTATSLVRQPPPGEPEGAAQRGLPHIGRWPPASHAQCSVHR